MCPTNCTPVIRGKKKAGNPPIPKLILPLNPSGPSSSHKCPRTYYLYTPFSRLVPPFSFTSCSALSFPAVFPLRSLWYFNLIYFLLDIFYPLETVFPFHKTAGKTESPPFLDLLVELLFWFRHSQQPWIKLLWSSLYGLSWWLRGKNLPANAGDTGLIPDSGRCTGEGDGNPLQYSCLGNLIGKPGLLLRQGISGTIPLEAENTETLSHTYFWGKAPLVVLVKSWLSSSVEVRESFSYRDDMRCTEHSSSCSTELMILYTWDGGLRESLEKAIVLHLFWTEGLTSFWHIKRCAEFIASKGDDAWLFVKIDRNTNITVPTNKVILCIC